VCKVSHLSTLKLNYPFYTLFSVCKIVFYVPTQLRNQRKQQNKRKAYFSFDERLLNSITYWNGTQSSRKIILGIKLDTGIWYTQVRICVSAFAIA